MASLPNSLNANASIGTLADFVSGASCPLRDTPNLCCFLLMRSPFGNGSLLSSDFRRSVRHIANPNLRLCSPRGNTVKRDRLRREIVPCARYRRDRAALMPADRAPQRPLQTVRALAGTKLRDDCGPWQRGCVAAWERAKGPEPLRGVRRG